MTHPTLLPLLDARIRQLTLSARWCRQRLLVLAVGQLWRRAVKHAGGNPYAVAIVAIREYAEMMGIPEVSKENAA